jgi:hypothetical protein
MSDKFSCRTCYGYNFELEDMKKEKSLMPYKRGICKSCHTKYNKLNLQIKRAERSPEDYRGCNECGRIFSKYKTGAPTKFREFRKECPHCKSDEICSYLNKKVGSN